MIAQKGRKMKKLEVTLRVTVRSELICQRSDVLAEQKNPNAGGLEIIRMYDDMRISAFSERCAGEFKN